MTGLGSVTTVVTVVALVLACAVVLGRLAHRLGGRRDARLAAQERPWLLQLTGGEGDPAEPLERLAALDRRRWRAIAPQAVKLLALVRGRGHQALAELFERRGLVGQALGRLSGPGPMRRASAAHLLGLVAEREAVPKLCRLLGDRDPQTRAVAARALGQIADPAAAEPLVESLASARPVPTHVVARALMRIGDPARPVLVEALAHPDPAVRITAVVVLGHTAPVAAVPPLTRTLADDPDDEVRVNAARALGRIGTRACLAPLAETAAGTAPQAVRTAAVEALGDLGSPEAVPVLRPLLDAPEYRLAHAAAYTLTRLGDTGRRELAAAEAAGPDDPAAPHAREALAVLALREDARPIAGPAER
ncbi:HEAT repeat domain-containing protein [Actinomadura hibisca]|uniref:HEAT repeat domain-containing protein n=1 Tax=Actinomadura hibisca TaxID=68565 RepID=UPI0008378CB5|nr:HEAT repeat domain-containing protein [Actinomadura hibisca]